MEGDRRFLRGTGITLFGQGSIRDGIAQHLGACLKTGLILGIFPGAKGLELRRGPLPVRPVVMPGDAGDIGMVSHVGEGGLRGAG